MIPLVGGRIRIHQPSVPGQPGPEVFTPKEKAEKAARLVIKNGVQGVGSSSLLAPTSKDKGFRYSETLFYLPVYTLEYTTS